MPSKRTLTDADSTGDRVEQLATLAAILASAIDACDDPKELSQLSRQYREATRELAEARAEEPEEADIVVELRDRRGR